MLGFKGRICVLVDEEMERRIMDKGNKGYLSLHPSMSKMYQDLKESFWWSGMKKEIGQYIVTCMTFQKAKVEHEMHGGLL